MQRHFCRAHYSEALGGGGPSQPMTPPFQQASYSPNNSTAQMLVSRKKLRRGTIQKQVQQATKMNATPKAVSTSVKLCGLYTIAGVASECNSP